ncbi:hypothetical protein [Spiroplasma endosymbiont of Labia minor]|uniref:hypothetical protein n=1 Tax=Spiroplasma endosymbiont of Labia minor TaxID=3066305 RepID=UPI0030CC8653
MFRKILLKELYIEDLNFANNMVDPFKTFSKRYNFLLKPKYPSFVDEIKRQLWFSKNILISGLGLNKVTELVANLIYSNFKNGNLITDNNIYLIKFLEEKKTDKIYKVINLTSGNWHYSTLGENSILSVRFKIRRKFFSKKILIKYFQGYM